MADSLNYNLDYDNIPALRSPSSSSHADGSEMIIGKIPGYNSEIDQNGEFRKKLIDSMAVVTFKPTGYGVDFSKLAEGKFSKVLTSAINNSTFNPQKMFSDTLVANKLEGVSKITVIASNDSSINETMGNRYEEGFLSKMSDKFKDGGFVKASKNFQQITSMQTQDLIDKYGKSLSASYLENGSGAQQSADAFLEITGLLASGFNINLPRFWSSSSYNSSLNLTIKLNSPYGDPEAVEEFILRPLLYLLSLCAPISKYGLFTGQPFMFDVKISGLAHYKLAGIQNVTITRGGNDTIFNKYGQPLSVDVRMNVIPLINAFGMNHRHGKIGIGGKDGVDPLLNTPSNVARSMMNSVFKIP